ncbi:OmpA family protein [Sulfitobacter noctilucicola]|uniref:Outer membrane protein OmpA-like peptidoglycan-associated protein n=1 Tax=Sulfitobacter noctilucicola TaxID=1342301 RepID=A0A7W6Q4W0_9RHOB|nr:OmpA family protein [Sulfitobacter noctilucicola]MBB4174624.1 outer membrane protein OmpA-like peptidoglycan-associated protein [Sulfitobacter noctilucicola]
MYFSILRHQFTILAVAALMVLAGLTPTANAQQNPFSGGWTLQPEMSNLNFQSVKKQTVVESSSFATLEGAIAENGATEVSVLLDSVDTKIDLRNVRMRFLFFETFKFPTAKITTQLDASVLNDLATVRRKTVPVSYTMDLHGVSQTYEAEVAVTLLTEDLVSVASTTPISVSVDDFDLMEGLGKLQEAANVTIIPSATVSFDFLFARNTTTAAAAPAQTATADPASVALEAEGDFDRDACKGRFEILSRTGNIYFASGSSRHDSKSEPLLNSLAGIIARCPNMVIEVGGHTDSVGSNATNQRLSDARANSVRRYLISRDVSPDVLVSKGYGETTPLKTNDTAEGRWANRRIEFKVLSN